MTKGELTKATMTWRQAHFGAVMSGLLQLAHTSSNETGVEKEVSHSSLRGDPMQVRRFWVDNVRGPVCTTQKVTITPFSTVSVHANSSVKGHCMWVHVLMEPMAGPQLPTAVVPMVTYGVLHLGSSRVPICLHNWSAHTMEIPTKAVGGQVAPANQVPPVVLQPGVQSQTPKGMGPGGSRPPRPQRIAQIRAEAGQRIAAQMGTPVCMQWPGPGQICSDQA